MAFYHLVAAILNHSVSFRPEWLQWGKSHSPGGIKKRHEQTVRGQHARPRSIQRVARMVSLPATASPLPPCHMFFPLWFQKNLLDRCHPRQGPVQFRASLRTVAPEAPAPDSVLRLVLWGPRPPADEPRPPEPCHGPLLSCVKHGRASVFPAHPQVDPKGIDLAFVSGMPQAVSSGKHNPFLLLTRPRFAAHGRIFLPADPSTCSEMPMYIAGLQYCHRA